MTKDASLYLEHILESIELIEKRTKDVVRKDFMNSVDLQDMVIRRLEIIGEAVRNLPKEFRRDHQEINWQDPADMRSALIHGYFDVDLEIVWNTVEKNLPDFKLKVQNLLKSLDN